MLNIHHHTSQPDIALNFRPTFPAFLISKQGSWPMPAHWYRRTLLCLFLVLGQRPHAFQTLCPTLELQLEVFVEDSQHSHPGRQEDGYIFRFCALDLTCLTLLMRMLEKVSLFPPIFCGKMWGIAADVHENHVTWFALSTHVAMNTIYESKCEHAKIHVLQWPKAHYTRFKGWYEVSFLLNPLQLITRKRNDKLQERESQPDKANPEIPRGR